MSDIVELIAGVRRDIQEAQNRAAAGHPVELLLVSKYVEAERVKIAYDAGVRMFGENKVQEWQQKKELLPADIQWHLIGHLQTNKVKAIVGQAALIHSLDRDELAKEIIKQAGKKEVASVDCLVQVNSTGEPSKSGLAPDEVLPFFERWAGEKVLRLRGLMTMGPHEGNEQEIREAFRLTKSLYDQLKAAYSECPIDTLSMGMSGDYTIAIEEGSTLVRVGSKVFGSRPSM